MTDDKIRAAIKESQRFIVAAVKALKRHKSEKNYGYKASSTKEDAACRRSSMDLTRALAEMRKP